MTTERIKEIRESKEKARIRQERTYQECGYGPYLSRARAYEEIVEICDRALASSEDHDAARNLKWDLFDLAREAKIAERDCRGCGGNTPVVLNKVLKLARKYGWRE